MKKKFLFTLLVCVVNASALLSGCGTEETIKKIENIQISEKKEMDSEIGGIKESIPEDKLQEWYNNLGNTEVTESSIEAVSLSSETIFAEKGDEVFKEELDAPGLSAMDWDLFNEIFNERLNQIKFDEENLGVLYEFTSFKGVSGHDIFAMIGNDPRMDWGVVSDNFNTYYGNTEEGITTFVLDMLYAYTNGYNENLLSVIDDRPVLDCIGIEPIHTNNYNDMYSDLVYEKHKEYYSGDVDKMSRELAEPYLSSDEFNVSTTANFAMTSYDISLLNIQAKLIHDIEGKELPEDAVRMYKTHLGVVKYLDEGVQSRFPDYYAEYKDCVVKLIQEEIPESNFYKSHVEVFTMVGFADRIIKIPETYEELMDFCNKYCN